MLNVILQSVEHFLLNLHYILLLVPQMWVCGTPSAEIQLDFMKKLSTNELYYLWFLSQHLILLFIYLIKDYNFKDKYKIILIMLPLIHNSNNDTYASQQCLFIPKVSEVSISVPLSKRIPFWSPSALQRIRLTTPSVFRQFYLCFYPTHYSSFAWSIINYLFEQYIVSILMSTDIFCLLLRIFSCRPLISSVVTWTARFSTKSKVLSAQQKLLKIDTKRLFKYWNIDKTKMLAIYIPCSLLELSTQLPRSDYRFLPCWITISHAHKYFER